MRRKYLVGPFICTFASWTIGNGTLPILPLYAMEHGASKSTSGLFLAFAFLCLALGTMTTGLLPKGFRNRKWLIAASGLGIAVLTWLTGYTTTLMQLAGAIGMTWFLAGIVFSQAATLTGLAADPTDRGAAFGILGMSSGLGALVGGLGVGYLADRLGFWGVFGGLAVFSSLIVIGGFLSVESTAAPTPAPAFGADAGQPAKKVTVGAVLVFLLASELLLAVTSATGSLGRSFAMSSGGFAKSTITLTAAIQGVVGMSFPFALGWLSDKVGRRWILIAIYLVTSISLVLLAFSRAAWHFYISVGLFTFLSFSLSVGPAYVMDIVPRESTAMGVSLFQSMFWAGNIAGMAASGFAFDRLGTTAPILLSCLFPVAGVILLLLIQGGRPVSVR